MTERFSVSRSVSSPNVVAPTVPTLGLEDGQGLLDSLAIAEYLDEKYPDRPSIFGNPSEKKLQLFFQSYVQAKLHPAIQRLVFDGMYDMQDPENAHYFRTSREKTLGMPYDKVAGDRDENLRELKENLGIIHAALRSGDWILGDQRKLEKTSWPLPRCFVTHPVTHILLYTPWLILLTLSGMGRLCSRIQLFMVPCMLT